MPKNRLIFLGSKSGGLAILRSVLRHAPSAVAAIICPDDSTDDRSAFVAFEKEAHSHGIPIHLTPIRSETERLLGLYSPCTAIVHGWYQILRTDHFEGIDFFGFHYSSLPSYRGNAPVVWQILNGERQVGISLFQLVPEMDAGRLYCQEAVPVGPDETVADVLDKANAQAEKMLERFLGDWSAGTLALYDQAKGGASYCALRVPEDGRIDWSQPGEAIHNFVRAQTKPYPGAFTSLPDGVRLTIWKTERETRTYHGVPGGVAEISENYVVITSGQGAVRLLLVQADGEQPVKASERLKSLKARLS